MRKVSKHEKKNANRLQYKIIKFNYVEVQTEQKKSCNMPNAFFSTLTNVDYVYFNILDMQIFVIKSKANILNNKGGC